MAIKQMEKQRQILYFINPISGTRNKEDLIKLIKDKTEQQQLSYQILHTNAEGDYAYLPQKIADENITDVVVCGGDGTVSQIGAFLVGVDVNLGIIPLGSGNGLAFAAKIPKLAHNALQLIFKGQAAYIDGFYINNHFSCMLCGLGFDAQVAQDFARQSKRGLATYIKQTVRNFFSAKPYPFTIATNHGSFTFDAWFISIANSNQFGNNVTIAPKASLNDGLLDIVVVKKMNKLLLLWKVFWQIRSGTIRPETSKDFNKSGILYFNASSLIIHNPQNAPLHIDGDPAPATTNFTIGVVPSALRLIQGNG
jgi:diacylglycerol kinase (ATP)